MPGQFSPPVRVSLGRAGNVAHSVTSPEKAAEILLTDWPTNWTAKHLAARKAVLKAMESAYTAATLARARDAFAEAADEAGILLPEPPKSVARSGFRMPGWNSARQKLECKRSHGASVSREERLLPFDERMHTARKR